LTDFSADQSLGSVSPQPVTKDFFDSHAVLHHRYPDKNFNVALPVGDLLCGTMAKATEADWQAMRLEGIA